MQRQLIKIKKLSGFPGSRTKKVVLLRLDQASHSRIYRRLPEFKQRPIAFPRTQLIKLFDPVQTQPPLFFSLDKEIGIGVGVNKFPQFKAEFLDIAEDDGVALRNSHRPQFTVLTIGEVMSAHSASDMVRLGFQYRAPATPLLQLESGR